MGEAELLLSILAFVYLTECLAWIPHGTVLIVTLTGKRFRIRYPGKLPGNDRGSFYLAPPIPPLGTVLKISSIPFTMSQEWLLAWPAVRWEPQRHPPRTGPAVRWNTIKSLSTRGRVVLINQQHFYRADSPEQASWLSLRLRRLAKAPSTERSEAIDRWIQDSLDSEGAKKRWREFQRADRLLRWQVNIAFCYLFILIPALALQYELAVLGLVLVVGLLAQTISVAVRFRKLHRELMPEREEERFKGWLTMILSPPAALRAIDSLSKNIWSQYDVLVAAKLRLSEEDFAKVAERIWRELHFPMSPGYPSGEESVRMTVDEHRERLIHILRPWLSRAGLNVEAMSHPPKPSEPDHVAYCPRCLGQFVTARGRCQDCGIDPLLPLPREDLVQESPPLSPPGTES